jgi:hypothetical protein
VLTIESTVNVKPFTVVVLDRADARLGGGRSISFRLIEFSFCRSLELIKTMKAMNPMIPITKIKIHIACAEK